MGRVIVFFVLMMLVVGTLVAGPAERFGKVYSEVVGKSGDAIMVATYNGAAFRADKLTMVSMTESGTDFCTLTVYIPLSSGPSTASDSVEIQLIPRANTATWIDYYGPISDTVRVKNDENCYTTVYFYGW